MQAQNAEKQLKTKKQIANHYRVGLRTVTKLMRRRILPYTRLRNLVRFDLDQCDRAFEFFLTPSIHGNGYRPGTDRDWRTKRQIGAHFQVSERTITTLMRQRILPYVKLGRLVRLDLHECCRILQLFGVKTCMHRRRRASTVPDVAAKPDPCGTPS